MSTLVETCPPDDRTPERRVFPGASRQVLGMAMRRGCQAAGLALYSPHDLRHRYASVKVKEGVPVTELAAQLGHARKSMTLDTYSHVLLDGEWLRSSDALVLSGSAMHPKTEHLSLGRRLVANRHKRGEHLPRLTGNRFKVGECRFVRLGVFVVAKPPAPNE